MYMLERFIFISYSPGGVTACGYQLTDSSSMPSTSLTMLLLRLVVFVVFVDACIHIASGNHFDGLPHPHRHHHEAPRIRSKHSKRQTNVRQEKTLMVNIAGRDRPPVRSSEQWTASVDGDGRIALVNELECPSCTYHLLVFRVDLFSGFQRRDSRQYIRPLGNSEVPSIGTTHEFAFGPPPRPPFAKVAPDVVFSIAPRC
jgi:hypothetical protein